MADNKDNKSDNSGIGRRDWLKTFVSLPVFGAFGLGLYQKWQSGKEKKQRILSELGLEQNVTRPENIQTDQNNNLIRIGIIGFGGRGEFVSRMLGYAMPEWIKTQKEENLNDWLQQGDLNVAITGICDVFDLHAEKGINASQSEFRSQKVKAKKYKNYRQLLDSQDIDAVIITAPDFHHGQMTIDAANAGKHVYCEKCMTRTEQEVYNVEKAINENNVVYQLGHQYHQNSAFDKAREIIEKNILGKVTLIETTTNRNSANGAWVRHTKSDGTIKPGNPQNIDWNLWLGNAPKVPFSIDRFYNWTKWWDYATGLSGQLMSHEIDLANQLLGLGIPASCVASGGIYFHKDNREIPDIFHAVFEYPEKDLSFVYSASLANSRDRGRVFMGHDASMKLGNDLVLSIDSNSTQFKQQIAQGLFDKSKPTITFNSSGNDVDAVTSATERYYASRGLTHTYKDGKKLNTTFLHLQEWLNGIRNGSPVSVPVEKGVEVTIACHMATRSYLENRKVFWDPLKRRII